ncbi:Bifunctional inhibitor/lipid-transfer protein/seed storage 2S albumin superfamily protein [Thalictrum thalictroides]|uniref:Bifunctional inhibitor/lipid-transfer protein/seed storage 2S albumin superfamily protein n=1 Tax=Thalictrum thalictroides TaxID=46969 RepID=A0A7J6WVQ3_THATH|nr:Bifunctional inhibitor/lipid-transfer protein/seed storage 2S albumin superfamily protein [Thalictrum thalictroides]
MDSSSSSNLLFITIILLSSSWVSMGSVEDLQQFGLAAAAGVAEASAWMTCAQKLLPCKDYLNSSTTPPSSCCDPLKEMINDDFKCLCNVFNDPIILKAINITQDVALKVVGACDAKIDVSVCNKDANTPPSSADANTPPSSADANTPPFSAESPSGGTAGSSNSTAKSSANGLSQVGGYCVITLFMSLFTSAAL